MISRLHEVVDPARQIAEELLGARVDKVEPVAGGRNSRVYRVQTGESRFALKRYPSRADDPRDRLGTEVDALRVMGECGLGNVARVVAVDRARNFVLLSWLEGTLLASVGQADVDQAAAFLDVLHRMRWSIRFDREAAEACLSGYEVEAQIRRRLDALRAQCGEEPELMAFLREAFSPRLEEAARTARTRMMAQGLGFSRALPKEKRSLVPADFGFHNCLRGGDGTLVFLDFEYFGWDDPVKLTADTLLHPGVPMEGRERERFRNAALELYTEDETFAARLSALYPLFGLRWGLILLNEFLPERWRLRSAAGETEAWTAAKARQLARARQFVARIEEKENA
jgi:Ser/Thr protein kinase RdoA (MazF antagonist)